MDADSISSDLQTATRFNITFFVGHSAPSDAFLEEEGF